ncbi:carboxylesterase family protein [Kribbella turkmenica]|uniref:Carboxylic ester hydrolase n=2 Tax=Kribbella turkmenica TaxID=2530375 RepID=A0A4V2YH78_9ACTN|nr:carboxylesterase family protein [Kribbella turkmenica]
MALIAVLAGTAVPAAGGVVRVDSGWLRGSVAADHVAYPGVPYAAPPVGERRWRPPARVQPWSGIRNATAPSTPCAQQAGAVGAEDCLYLDVKVPHRVRPGERLPVLVWLPGGGFAAGASQEYDGSELATSGRLMVVTVNYRLGALGYLSSPALGQGNYGLMDQAAALRWVRRNAASFGGDPGNVTLAGQSAGARSVCALLASPLGRGLFHRAITQSGACDNRVPTLTEARAVGAKATEDLGCTAAPDVAACLRAHPPTRVLSVLSGLPPVHGRAGDRPWGPSAGTSVLPRQPGDALRTGTAARVPLLIGGTADEMRGFVSRQSSLTAEQYRAMMVETFGDRADAVLAKYPVTSTPALALATALSDWGGFIGACPVLRTAQAAAVRQPVYAYEFAEDSGRVTSDGFPLGAYHSQDLPYLWTVNMPQNPYPPLTAEQERLSATMIEYWTAFARTGNPNGTGRPHWPAFNHRGTVLGLSTTGIAPTPYATDHRCGFWQDLPR